MKKFKKTIKAPGSGHIARKIAIPLCCLIFFLMAGFGITVYTRTQVAMTALTTDKGWSTVRAGTAFAAEHLQAGNPELLGELLSNIKTDPEVAYASIINAAGKIVAQTGPKAEPQNTPSQGAQTDPQTIAAPMIQPESLTKEPVASVTPGGIRKIGSIDFTTPIITAGGSTLGYFKLGLTTQSLNAQLNNLLIIIVLITVISSAAGIFLALIITKRVLQKPIHDLMSATEHIASGDFTNKVPVHSMDELGCLSTGFNHMTVHLGNLFDSVRTSTAELSRSSQKIVSSSESIATSPTPEKQQEAIKEINGSARRMARLVDRLNNLSLQFKT